MLVGNSARRPDVVIPSSSQHVLVQCLQRHPDLRGLRRPHRHEGIDAQRLRDPIREDMSQSPIGELLSNFRLCLERQPCTLQRQPADQRLVVADHTRFHGHAVLLEPLGRSQRREQDCDVADRPAQGDLRPRLPNVRLRDERIEPLPGVTGDRQCLQRRLGAGARNYHGECAEWVYGSPDGRRIAPRWDCRREVFSESAAHPLLGSALSMQSISPP